MPTLEFTSEIAAPVEKVWAFYDSLDTLRAITPPATKVTIKDPPQRITQGVRFTLIVRQPPVFIPLSWETIITEHTPPYRFVDEQGKGPFASWRHEHLFEPLANGNTRLRDVVTYRPPLGPLGWIADRLFIRAQLTAMFTYRHQKTRESLTG